jgi:transposase
MSRTNIGQKEEFTKLREQGMTYQAIADMYGVSRQCIHQILNRDKVNERLKSEKYKEKRKRYYKDNREKIQEYQKRWREKHPNYMHAYYKSHRSKKVIDKN